MWPQLKSKPRDLAAVDKESVVVEEGEEEDSYGYTFDSVRNQMLSQTQHVRMRFDRIMHKLEPPCLASEIDLIGTSPLNGAGGFSVSEMKGNLGTISTIS